MGAAIDFLKPHESYIYGFSKAFWGVCTDYQRALETLFVTLYGFIKAIKQFSKKDKEISENSKTFCKM
jgi:hypothetical protein